MENIRPVYELKEGVKYVTTWIDDHVEKKKNNTVVNAPYIGAIGGRFHLAPMKKINQEKCTGIYSEKHFCHPVEVTREELERRGVFLRLTRSFQATLENIEFFINLTRSQAGFKVYEETIKNNTAPHPISLTNINVGLEFFTVWHNVENNIILLGGGTYQVIEIGTLPNKELYIIFKYQTFEKTTSHNVKANLITELKRRGIIPYLTRTFEYGRTFEYDDKLHLLSAEDIKNKTIKQYLEIIRE